MTNSTDFIAAIKANPDCDTTRLAYADWLDENDWHQTTALLLRLAVQLKRIKAARDDDEPRLRYAEICEGYGLTERAEFIRIQCELAKWKHPEQMWLKGRLMGPQFNHGILARDTSNPHYKESVKKERALEQREWELLKANASEWFGDGAVYPDSVKGRRRVNGKDHQYALDRGFIGYINCSAELWEKHGDDLDTEHCIREVILTTRLSGLDCDTSFIDKFGYNIAGRWVWIDRKDAHGKTEQEAQQHVLGLRWPGIAFSVNQDGNTQTRTFSEPVYGHFNEGISLTDHIAELSRRASENLAEAQRRVAHHVMSDYGVTDLGSMSMMVMQQYNAPQYNAPFPPTIECGCGTRTRVELNRGQRFIDLGDGRGLFDIAHGRCQGCQRIHFGARQSSIAIDQVSAEFQAYVERLRGEILQGMGIPPGVLEAGWSNESQDIRDDLRQFQEQANREAGMPPESDE